MGSVPAVRDRPWLSHYDEGVPGEVDYPEISLPELMARTAREYPDRVATNLRGAKLTYRQLAAQIDAFAAGLQALGIARGERVAILLPNVPQFIVAFYGALEAGAVVVPTNPLYTAKELEHQLADAGATVLVILDQFFEKAEAALAGTRVRTVICAGVGTALPRHLSAVYEWKMWRTGVRKVKRGGVVVRFEDVLKPVAAPAAPHLEPDDLAVLQYTGGTTGTSKSAMLTHRNLIANAVQVHLWQGGDFDKPKKVLCIAPFFHVYGLTVCMNQAILSGSTMILVPRFIPEEVVQIIAKERPQLFPGVPTMYVGLYSLPGISRDALSSLSVCISGAMPLPPEVQLRFEEVSGSRVVEGYGLTEAAPVTHCNPVRGDRRPGTVGVPFPGTDATITDPITWEPLPPGTVGEMTVRGPQVMKGYWNRPEETEAVLRDGWLHTGDLATMDEDGYFRIVDRKKDMIIVSGFNVYPREVEDVLYEHPKILEAAVVGDTHDYKGESVKAVVALRDGHQATPEEIIAHCREHLAPFKVPRTVEFRGELPKSMVGKVLRRELKSSSPASIEGEQGKSMRPKE